MKSPKKNKILGFLAACMLALEAVFKKDPLKKEKICMMQTKDGKR